MDFILVKIDVNASCFADTEIDKMKDDGTEVMTYSL